MKKKVNGEDVELTQVEIDAHKARITKFKAKPAPEKPVGLKALADLLEAKGVITSAEVTALKS